MSIFLGIFKYLFTLKDMTRYIFFVLFFFSSVIGAQGQALLKSIDLPKATILNVDETGHIYVVYEKRNIRKYSPELELLQEFRAIKNGEIKQLDVNNPMEIIYFQPTFNRMTIIDRLFAPKFDIDFNQYNHQNVSAVAQSIDNQYWMYDHLNAQLIKINKQYLEVSRSNDLRLSHINDFEPQSLQESGGYILAFERGHGFVLFDRYANVVNHQWDMDDVIQLHLDHEHWVEVYEKSVLIKSYDQLTTAYKLLSEKNIVDSRLFKNRLVLLDESGIKVYDVTPQ